MSGKPIDRTNQVYGLLTVIERAPDRAGSGHAYWICRCECGNVVQVRSNGLGTTTTSCGCVRANPEIRRAARMKTGPKQRKRIARAAALARWGKV